MDRICSLTTRSSFKSIRYISQLINNQRYMHRATPVAFHNATSADYIEEMYKQWSKDSQSVHKVFDLHLFRNLNLSFVLFSLGISIFAIKMR